MAFNWNQFQAADAAPAAPQDGFNWNQFQEAPAQPTQPVYNADPRFDESGEVAAAGLRGVPILGALVNKAGAAVSAAANPVTGVGAPGDTFADRYAKNLAQENAAEQGYEAEHPIENAAAGLVGGSAVLGPLAETSLGARLLGLTGGNIAARTIASGLTGAGLNAADATLRGNDPTQGVEIGALTGIAGPLVGRVAGAAMNLVRPVAKAALPTSQDLIDSAANSYHAPEIKAVEFQPTAISDLSDSIAADLNGKRINARIAPQTHGLLEDLKQPINGQYFTMEDLTTARQLLGDVAGNISNKTDATGAIRAKQMIDNYLADVPGIDVTAGDANAAGQVLKNANADYAAGKTAQALEGKIDAADLQAASANSGANFENALRQRIRSILTSPTQRRGFSPDEVAAMQSIVRGTASQNVLRIIGNLLGGGGGIGALASGSTAALAGAGPASVLVPAAGFAIKKLGNAIMDSKANALDELIRSRAPAAQQAVVSRLAAAAAERARLARLQNAGAIAGHSVNPALASPDRAYQQ